MEQTTANIHWQAFCATGSVAEYLAYKKALSEETKHEIFHQRTDYSGTPRGRSGSFGDRSYS